MCRRTSTSLLAYTRVFFFEGGGHKYAVPPTIHPLHPLQLFDLLFLPIPCCPFPGSFSTSALRSPTVEYRRR